MIIPNAEPPLVFRDQRLCFGPGHAGQVVHIQVALSAETSSLVADHLFPIGIAWGSDSHVIERIIESGHNIPQPLAGMEVDRCSLHAHLQLLNRGLWPDVSNPLQIGQCLEFLERQATDDEF